MKKITFRKNNNQARHVNLRTCLAHKKRYVLCVMPFFSILENKQHVIHPLFTLEKKNAKNASSTLIDHPTLVSPEFGDQSVIGKLGQWYFML
jgi:hypothetical protein